MKRLLVCAAAIAAAALGACADPASTTSLAGKWVGSITCYNMDSPLSVAIDAASPGKATVAMGDAGALTWQAAVEFDHSVEPTRLPITKPSVDEAPREAGIIDLPQYRKYALALDYVLHGNIGIRND